MATILTAQRGKWNAGEEEAKDPGSEFHTCFQWSSQCFRPGLRFTIIIFTLVLCGSHKICHVRVTIHECHFHPGSLWFTQNLSCSGYNSRSSFSPWLSVVHTKSFMFGLQLPIVIFTLVLCGSHKSFKSGLQFTSVIYTGSLWFTQIV